MGLKENFNQAMKELLNRGGLVGSEKEDKARSTSDLDSYLDVPPFDSGERFSQSGVTQNERVQEKLPEDIDEEYWKSPPREERTSAYRREPGTSTNYSAFSHDEYGRMFRPAEEMTIISKNTMIIGDIKTLANITIEGKVHGQVEALKDANILGMLIGDLTCNNGDIRGSSIQGNVTAKGSTYIDNDSILLGDIAAQFASIDGKVKGNIDIGSKVELRRNAIVAGNINTNTISIEDGANLRGYVNTTFLREHGDSAFPNKVVISGDGTE